MLDNLPKFYRMQKRQQMWMALRIANAKVPWRANCAGWAYAIT